MGSDVYWNFTYQCRCGQTVTVTEGREQPHEHIRERIELRDE